MTAIWTQEGRAPNFDEAAIEIEDSGQAVYFEVGDGEENGMFVRVQSWVNKKPEDDFSDLSKVHRDLAQFAGKKVKVTIEVIPTLQDISRAKGRSIDERADPDHVRCGGSGWYMQFQEVIECDCTVRKT